MQLPFSPLALTTCICWLPETPVRNTAFDTETSYSCTLVWIKDILTNHQDILNLQNKMVGLLAQSYSKSFVNHFLWNFKIKLWVTSIHLNWLYILKHPELQFNSMSAIIIDLQNRQSFNQIIWATQILKIVVLCLCLEWPETYGKDVLF